MCHVHKIASAHLSNVRNKFSDLFKLESVLAEMVMQCSDALSPTARRSIFWMLARQSDLNHISDA
jgi:hypothetical protein